MKSQHLWTGGSGPAGVYHRQGYKQVWKQAILVVSNVCMYISIFSMLLTTQYTQGKKCVESRIFKNPSRAFFSVITMLFL